MVARWLRGRRGKVFISYRRVAGLDAAMRIKKDLDAHRFDAALDVTENIVGQWRTHLEQKVAASDVVVLVLTPGDLDCEKEDDVLFQEIAVALEKKKTIIPVIPERFQWPEPMPDAVRILPEMQYVRLVPEFYEQGLKQLLMMVRTAVQTERETVVPVAPVAEMPQRRRRWPKTTAAAAILVLLLAAGGVLQHHGEPADGGSSRADQAATAGSTDATTTTAPAPLPPATADGEEEERLQAPQGDPTAIGEVDPRIVAAVGRVEVYVGYSSTDNRLPVMNDLRAICGSVDKALPSLRTLALSDDHALAEKALMMEVHFDHAMPPEVAKNVIVRMSGSDSGSVTQTLCSALSDACDANAAWLGPELRAAAVPELAFVAQYQSSSVARSAVEALAAVATPAAYSVLRRCVLEKWGGDESFCAWQTAAQALAESHRPGADETLVALLRNKDVAPDALADIVYWEKCSRLGSLSGELRAATRDAAQQLVTLGLREHLHDFALAVLMALDPDAAVKAVTRAAKDADDQVAQSVVTAMTDLSIYSSEAVSFRAALRRSEPGRQAVRQLVTRLKGAGKLSESQETTISKLTGDTP